MLKNKNLYILIFVLISIQVYGSLSDISSSSIPFVENIGQNEKSIRFSAVTFNGTVLITDQSKIIYSIPAKESQDSCLNIRENQFIECFTNQLRNNPSGLNKTSTKINSFKGSDETNWKRNIPSYKVVDLGEIYPNIHLRLHAYSQNVEKLFYVKPGGNPQKITGFFSNSSHLNTNNKGELIVSSKTGELKFTKPVAYQIINNEKKFIGVEYAVSANEYSFKLEEYDKSRELIIDPLLASTYLGGSTNDDEYEPCIIKDSEGNVYVSGYTFSYDFPTTEGTYGENYHGYIDRFVSKFSPDLSTLISSTLIGGNGAEYGMGICLDQDENVYLGGYTSSVNFPITEGAFGTLYSGNQDAFIVKLNNDLTELIASTYYGGSNYEAQWFPRFDMVVGNNGNLYVTGLTQSLDLPMADNSYNPFNFGEMDIFVAQFTSDLTELIGSTYLGSPSYEWRPSILIDSQNNVFIGADAAMQGYPTTENAYDQSFNGGSYDVVVTKLSEDLSQLLASTYLGTNAEEDLLGMKLNSNDELIITGYTTSANFPVTTGSYDTSYNGGEKDIYVTKFDNNLSNIVYSTFIGGNGLDVGHDVALDENEDIYIVGHTMSYNFPTSENAYDTDFNGGEDTYILKLSMDFSEILASTLIGGIGDERGQGIIIGNNGNIYITGRTTSPDYPVTTNAIDDTFNGPNDCFLSLFDSNLTGFVNNEDYQHNKLEKIKLKHYPNPFHKNQLRTSNIKIEYELDKPQEIELNIYNSIGQKIEVLDEGYKTNLKNTVSWNCQQFPSGLYFYKLTTPNSELSKKIVLVK